MRTFIATALFISSLSAIAQNGTLRGTVLDGETGETIIGAAVSCATCGSGNTATDLDGHFTLKATPGTHTLEISYFTFQTLKVTGVKVTANEVTVIGELTLQPEDNLKLDEVTIVAEVQRNTDVALLTLKKKSTAMVDGISAARISQIGDATAVEAAKRVTGVTVEGGKYVYIRGLGDRYSKTTLNGMDIPGLDPDKNTIQMDIFPTDLVSNIVVSKSFTADQPADFTGGLLNIETKAFPDKKLGSFSISTSYNPAMNLNPNYLTYQGGSLDFLGFDDGTRRLPAGARASQIPTPIFFPTSEVNAFVQSFNPTLGAMKRMSLMDVSMGYSAGNQWEGKKATKSGELPKLGYVFSLTYKNNYTFYDDVFYGEYQRYTDPSAYEMRYATKQTGQLGEQSTLIGGILGFAYKTNLKKYRFTLMHLQNGESRAGQFMIDNDDEAVGQSGYLAFANNLEYNQRSLTNILINGSTVKPEKNIEIDWRISPTLSLSTDPDIRKTAFTYGPLDTFFSAGAGGNPSRIWRYLQEVNLPFRYDITKKYTFMDEPAKLLYGVGNAFKFRHYEILFYDMQFFGLQNWSSDDPNQVLNPDNIYPNYPNRIYYQSGNNTPNPNEYASNSNTAHAYVSTEVALNIRTKAVIGLRAEHFIQRHTGRDQTYASGDVTNGKNLANEVVLNSLDLFPSLNVIYSLNESQNLRFSATRTIARPSFKELSFAQIIDPLTNRIFNGSFFEYAAWSGQLVETRVNNADLRWEKFFERGQMFSISGFLKDFSNPIELVRIAEQQTSTEFQPRNVGRGTMLGAELEWNASFAGVSQKLENLFFNGNVTLIESQITMSDVEFNSRKSYECVGETIVNTRAMAGQSPYVLNGGLSYTAPESQTNLGVYYNVKGPTLQIVGMGLFPDVYTQPFHSLNFSFTTKLGKEKGIDLKLRASNMLNDDVLSVYKSYGATDQIFSRYAPGWSVSAGLTFKL